MPEPSYTSRRELDQYTFPAAVTILAPLACLLLGALLPRVWLRLEVLDLPLLATIYFAISRRTPVAGSVTGMLIGLFQDGLTSLPFGVNGLAKTLIGYGCGSLAFAIDVDNLLNRVLITFAASLLQAGILHVITRVLLGEAAVHVRPVYVLAAAGVNTAVAIPLFLLLDRFRRLD